MNDKYVIKNCPAFDSKYNECHSKIEPHKLYCQDYTDCVMKKIVEKCRDSKFYLKHYGHPENDGVKNYTLAKEILELLNIEECE